MKLISMTDFVLEINKGDEDDIFIDYSKIINYAQFLKKPLNLGMFVPCDLEGNVLTYPIYNTNHSDDCYCRKCEEETKKCESQKEKYEKAKERVLFKGFELDYKSDYTIIVYNKNIDVEVKFRNQDLQKTTIEKQFINHYTKPLELTESGIKQFM